MQHRPAKCGGYALVTALILLVLVSLGTAAAVLNQRVAAQRERELQLLFVGDQYRHALQSYYAHVRPGKVPEYPKQLEDLLNDERFEVPVRHLRKLYPDPLSGKNDWVLERSGGQIVALHSAHAGTPLLHAGFAAEDRGFASAHTYADWRFAASDVSSPAGSPAVATGADSASNSSSFASSATNNTPTPNPPTPSPRDIQITCYTNYILPSWNCSDDPPPAGTNMRTCVAYYTQQYNACLASGAVSLGN